MRPTDKTRNQDLPRGQGDHAALYVSLELSRSTWLVTSLSPNSHKMSEHTISAGDASKLLALLARLRTAAEDIAGLEAWRAAGLRNGCATHTGARGQPPPLT